MGIFLTVSLTAHAHAEMIEEKEVPPEVISAFERTYPNAEVVGCSREMRGESLVFEIESRECGTRRDIIYSPDGFALEVEESIAPGALPAAVRRSLSVKYPEGRIAAAERFITGHQRFYDVNMVQNDEKLEVRLDEKGNIVKVTP